MAVNKEVVTPAYIFDHRCMESNAKSVKRLQELSGCIVLYSSKALSFPIAKPIIAAMDCGVSVSSLFEAVAARESSGSARLVCLVGTVVRNSELTEIRSLCDRVTLNSFNQLQRFGREFVEHCDVGIRVNPNKSFLDDPRYDPCRSNSKLGVSITELPSMFQSDSRFDGLVSGLHFHSNCDSQDFGQLVATIRHVEAVIGNDLRRFRWLNIGGGYLFDSGDVLRPLADEICRIRDTFGVEISIEPGAAFVRSAGSLVSTVEDIIESDSQPIAILDTTVNHWPEVFEYQFEPDVEGHTDDGPFTYQLAGCSCLAGDVFGVYSFNEPLEIGSRVVFRNAGAYSIVKAHMFNGINLPNIYAITEAGDLVLVKQFTYDDFASRCGVDTRAVV